MIFLIHYDRSSRALVSIESFEDRTIASKAKLEKELELLQFTNGHEVVLLESESEQSLRTTHKRYFDTLTGIRAGESEAYSSASPKFIKRWTIRHVRKGWSVQAEGVPEAIYPSKEQAIGAASKDSKDWGRSTGNATSVRVWNAEKGEFDEVTSGS